LRLRGYRARIDFEISKSRAAHDFTRTVARAWGRVRRTRAGTL